MNTSQFMDKQIMDLCKDFIDLMNNPREVDDEDQRLNNSSIGGNGIKREEIVPSFDFQPIRPPPQSQNLDGGSIIGGSAARVWNSADSKSNSASPIRNYGSLGAVEPSKFNLGKDPNLSEIVSEIEKTVKKHTDNLLHALEGVSARLTQLESRSRNLENTVDDLKVSVGNNYGSTDGKMKELENIMREVQTGVQVLKEKQDIVEAQLQLAKLRVSKPEQQLDTQNNMHMDSVQQTASAPLQSHQHPPPPPITFPQSLPPPPPNVPPPPPSQGTMSPPVQVPVQFSQNQNPSVPQREPYFPPPAQTHEVPNQQYQVHPTQQPVPPSATAQPHQPPYQPPPQPYSQPPQPPQLQPSLAHHPDEPPYIPSQTYPPNVRAPPSQPPSGPPSSQQFYGASPHMYEPPAGRSGSGFSGGYGSQSGPCESYPYGGSPSQYGNNATMKPPQLSSSLAQSGGYPQLPTARVLPHALPTASGVGGGPASPSSGGGNRVPIDDVVDKVTSMGFPRDHVRATVRKLTENGQSVDLNVVLDKLMNDGEVPQRGWFGR